MKGSRGAAAARPSVLKSTQISTQTPTPLPIRSRRLAARSLKPPHEARGGEREREGVLLRPCRVVSRPPCSLAIMCTTVAARFVLGPSSAALRHFMKTSLAPRCLNHVRAQLPSVDGSGRASTVPVVASACAARQGRGHLEVRAPGLCARSNGGRSSGGGHPTRSRFLRFYPPERIL